MTDGGEDRPMCDHRECQPNPNPAVVLHEGALNPTYPVQRYWSCPEHAPDSPPIKRVDPGPDSRAVDDADGEPMTDGGEDGPDPLDIPPEERPGPDETPEMPGVNAEPDDTGMPMTLREDAHADVHETERCDGAGSDACVRDDPELNRERDAIHVTKYGPGHSKSGRRVLCGDCRDKQNALNIAEDPDLALMYSEEIGDLRERYPDILGDVDLPVTDGGSEQVVVATGCNANSKRFHRESGNGRPECRYGNKDNLDWTGKTVNSIYSFYSPCGYCFPEGHDEYDRLTGNTEDRLMTDGGEVTEDSKQMEQYRERKELFMCPDCGSVADVCLTFKPEGSTTTTWKRWVTIHSEERDDGSRELYIHFDESEVDRAAGLRELLADDADDADPDPYRPPEDGRPDPEGYERAHNLPGPDPNAGEPRTDGGLEYPYYTWEVFGYDSGETGGSVTLFRRTETQKIPVFTATERADCEVDHRRFHSRDPEWTPGGREFREADHSGPVRDAFLAAVKAMFVRAPSGFTSEELQATRKPLKWYELEALDALRDGRNDGARGPGGRDSPALPSEAWDLIKQARSEITLSEWIGDTNPEVQADTEDAPLDRFTDGGVDDEPGTDNHSMGGVMELTEVYCPKAEKSYGPADGAESGMAFCPYCGEQSDHAGHEAQPGIAEVSCPVTTNATYRYCPGCGDPLDGGDE